MMSVVERTLNAVPVVQAFTREDVEHQRYRRLRRRAGHGAYQRTTAVGHAVQAAGRPDHRDRDRGRSSASAAFCALEGELTAGTILVFISYLASLYGPLNSITYTGETIQYAAAQADRVLELFDAGARREGLARTRKSTSTCAGHVRFEDVTFGYDEGRPVLQRRLPRRAARARWWRSSAPTGAGKTTLVNLLVRFFDPWAGRVTIDGHDLRDVKLAVAARADRDRPAGPVHLPATRSPRTSPTGGPTRRREEIEAAARAANAHAFIERLPEGYDTRRRRARRDALGRREAAAVDRARASSRTRRS